MIEKIIASELVRMVVNKFKRRSKRKMKRNLKIAGAFLVIFAVFFAGRNLIERHQVSGETVEQEISYAVDVPEKYDVVEVTVSKGSTAWDIQSTLVPVNEMNEALEIVEQLNEKDMSQIDVGEKLLFLATKNNQK